MEAHPCEKESFLDNLWRYINEIVSTFHYKIVIPWFMCIGFCCLKDE